MACSALLAYSQTTVPPTPPTPAQMVANQVDRLTTLLDLTSTQQASATTIFTTEQTALSTVRTGMQTARTALQTAIRSDDAGAIGTEAAQIGALNGQEVLAQATASAAFYASLTADQQSKYKTLGPLGGGPGGPGGPGAHGRGGSH
jgi:NADPH-dependent curcumin reductase CurA